ncbi:conserved hypothetical protein [gamma proteobacterium HTCC5015]|nr:conserved hypothetical protein [gamma proteobacterium HTCC5015]
MSTKKEETVWVGSPSQVINIPSFVIYGLFFWLILPLFLILWKWLVVKNTGYEITTQRLKTSYGVLNKKVDELELYRVKDSQLEQPFVLRLFSLSNIVLMTSDRSHPTVVIKAVPNGQDLREKIREYVEERRDSKRVREVDFE